MFRIATEYQVAEYTYEGGAKAYSIIWYRDDTLDAGFSTYEEAVQHAEEYILKHPEIFKG